MLVELFRVCMSLMKGATVIFVFMLWSFISNYIFRGTKIVLKGNNSVHLFDLEDLVRKAHIPHYTTNCRFIKIPWNTSEKPMNLFSGPWILHFLIFMASLKPINFSWKLLMAHENFFSWPWKVGDDTKMKLMGHENLFSWPWKFTNNQS